MKSNVDYLREIVEDYDNEEAEEFLDAIRDELNLLNEHNDDLIEKNIKLSDENICLQERVEHLENIDANYEIIDFGIGTLNIFSYDSIKLQLAVQFIEDNKNDFLKWAKVQ